MHATGAKTPSQCRFLELEGQRVEACRVPPYPNGGYYGNHIAYAWQRGDVAVNVTLHGHANEPRLRLMMAALIARETSPPVMPHIKAASIRRCPDDDRQGETGSRSLVDAAPGRLTVNCATVASMAAIAYVQYENGIGHSRWATSRSGTLLMGGPAWIHSERYFVAAVADDESSAALMAGPVLQALLEQRFGVKVRYETRSVPVYELKRAADFFRRYSMNEPSEQRCISLDVPAETPDPPALPAGRRWCASDLSAAAGRLVVEGATFEELAALMTAQPFMDRRVIDRTGVPGNFDVRLSWPTGSNGGSSSSSDVRRSFFKAMQEQGSLTIEPATGPARFLVIVSTSRPAVK